MKSLTRNSELNPVQFLIVLLLALGIFFRFFNLEGKVYWHDETYTSLRISGYTSQEVFQQLFDGRVIGIEDFAKFQHPNSEKGLIDTLKSLAIEDPQHPPFYYVMARFWVQWFGNSVTAMRSFSAFLSLLVFPCIYWLCRELFESPLVAMPTASFATALIAISPIHVLYAQEAREYTLWTVTLLLLSASLLRAMRLKTKFSWAIYAVTLALSLYTFLFSALVAVAQGIYIIVTERFRWTPIVTAFVIASLAGVFIFAPWIIVLNTNFSQFQDTTSWTMMKVPPLILIQAWSLHINRIFIDFDFGFENPVTYLITPAFLILVGYAIYFLCRNTPKQIWLFILTLIGVPALSLMLPDLVFGGLRSASSRYLIPSFLGIQLAVAYLLAAQLSSKSFSRRKIWQAMMTLLIVSGVVSCAVSSQAETWWSKVISYSNPKVARIINQAERPLLVSNSFGINPGNVFSLSYILDPKVRFQLVVDPNIPKIPDDSNAINRVSTVFLLSPSDKLREQVEKQKNSQSEGVYGDNHLWLLKLAKP
ncbi:glycosyltransferase family 39 protein [Coleofasciculus sp. H7-2]|uniref:glycosyltransferase family 39 protein n=1 Tax=Coleofasciculus sp. H7-2 TaxID=3351545 RepID=UPI003672D070